MTATKRAKIERRIRQLENDLTGDFLKVVVQGGGAQQFIYQPFREVSELREKYNELIYAVASKFPDETRHETALRYIQQAEKNDSDPQQSGKQNENTLQS